MSAERPQYIVAGFIFESQATLQQLVILSLYSTIKHSKGRSYNPDSPKNVVSPTSKELSIQLATIKWHVGRDEDLLQPLHLCSKVVLYTYNSFYGVYNIFYIIYIDLTLKKESKLNELPLLCIYTFTTRAYFHMLLPFLFLIKK